MRNVKLVTGGSGFLGMHMARALIDRGDRVRILDVEEPEKGIMERTEFIKSDIRDFDAVIRACKGVDAVYHAASVVPISKAGKEFYEINAGGTRNLLEAALQNKVSKVIHISSSSVYGDPKKGEVIDEDFRISPVGKYGKSKWEAEKLCFEYMKKGLTITIIRPRTVLGPGRLGIFSVLFDWVRRGRKIYIIGNGDNIFSFVSARDLVDACIKAEERCGNHIFNIGNEDRTVIRDDLEFLIKHANSDSRIFPLNAKASKFILKLLDKTGISPVTEFHYTAADKEYVFDVSRAKKMLGWEPRDSNRKMLMDTYDWYLHNRRNLREGKKHRFLQNQGILKLLGLFS